MQKFTLIFLISIIVMDQRCHAAKNITKAATPKVRTIRGGRIMPGLMQSLRPRMADCAYRPGYRKANRRAELICCNFWETRFYRRWSHGNEYLTSFMDLMKTWQCPQLKKHCQQRFFNFSPFTNVVYMRTCENKTYRRHCFKKVNAAALKHTQGRYNITLSADNITENEWATMVHGLQSKDMSDDEIANPCVQVALYEGGRGGHGRYHETIKAVIPFCGFAWCGYDADAVYSRHISVWRCIPTRCQVGIGVMAVIMICLGLIILFANIMVIAVYWYRKRMNNSQIVYKVTLAVGDVFVGAVVLPTFVSTMFMMYDTRNVMGDLIGVDLNETLNGEVLPPRRQPSGNYVVIFSHSYLSAVGFFTTASFLLSVYTLMLASFDRMVAICFPMSFIRSKALKVAKYACFCLVIVIFIIATLPVYTDSMVYGVVAAIIVSLGTRNAVILYSTIFLFPLFLVWLSNIILLFYSRRYAEIRRAISSASTSQIQDSERRLAKTLSIMVGAFSLTVIPTILVLLVSIALPQVHLPDPENLDGTATTVFNTVEFFIAIILSTNSLWNYFIYGSHDKDFKQHSKAVSRAVADRLGIIYLWKRINLSSRRRSTAMSVSSTFTSLSMTKGLDANKNARSPKASVSGNDAPSSDLKHLKIAGASLKSVESNAARPESF